MKWSNNNNITKIIILFKKFYLYFFFHSKEDLSLSILRALLFFCLQQQKQQPDFNLRTLCATALKENKQQAQNLILIQKKKKNTEEIKTMCVMKNYFSRRPLTLWWGQVVFIFFIIPFHKAMHTMLNFGVTILCLFLFVYFEFKAEMNHLIISV